MSTRNIVCVLALCGSLVTVGAEKKGHEIKVKIAGVKDTVCYLAGYYGPKQYYKDTAEVDSQGNMVFEGPDPLPGGIYSVVLPDKGTYFEFIVNEQFFSMETIKGDQAVMTRNMRTKGTIENEAFYEYLRFINEQQTKSRPWRNVTTDSLATKKKKKEAREKLGEIDQEVKSFKRKFMDDNHTLFVSKVFRSSEEPEVPEAPKLENDSVDKGFPRRYFMNHFWDSVDFADERLIRTPVLHTKLEKYMTKMVVQHPDSINVAADIVCAKAKANKEIFKYFVHYVTNNFEKSKIMGMDAVFVHMAQNYYMKGLAHWVDSTQLAKITERANKLSPTLLGKVTPNVILLDTNDAVPATDPSRWHNLHELTNEHIILYFGILVADTVRKRLPSLKHCTTA